MGKRRRAIDVRRGSRTGLGLAVASVEPPSSEPAQTERSAELILVSASFADGEALPVTHSADGANLSPPLAWVGVPREARSLVLLFEGPDPTGRPGRPFAHWVLYNLQPSSGGLEFGADQTGLPAGARRGTNDFGRTQYIGPVLDYGRQELSFRLFALDTTLDAVRLGSPTFEQLRSAMANHELAEAELACFVERSAPYQPTAH
jgi:Raf kinase inhibitor-like YbhB/YbcL family protein